MQARASRPAWVKWSLCGYLEESRKTRQLSSGKIVSYQLAPSSANFPKSPTLLHFGVNSPGYNVVFLK